MIYVCYTNEFKKKSKYLIYTIIVIIQVNNLKTTVYIECRRI